MFTLPTVRKLWANPWNGTACLLALMVAFLTSLQLLDNLFVPARTPTYSLSADVTDWQGSNASFQGTAVLDTAALFPSAGTVVQAALVSFGVLAALLFTAAGVQRFREAEVARAAGKMTLGVMILFLPVAIEWLAAIYIKPPIPWSTPWLIPVFITLWAAFFAAFWVAATFMFSGFFDGFGAIWRVVMGNNEDANETASLEGVAGGDVQPAEPRTA